jgi:ferredoxin
LIALTPTTDLNRLLDVTHPSSPLGLATVDASGCTGCGSCAQFCPTAALDLSEHEGLIALSYDPTLCTGCGQCVNACPEHVVKVDRSTDIGRLRKGRTTLFEDDTIRCQSCGAPVAPAAMLERIQSLLSADESGASKGTMATITQLCPDCRAKGVRLGR